MESALDITAGHAHIGLVDLQRMREGLLKRSRGVHLRTHMCVRGGGGGGREGNVNGLLRDES